MMNSGNLFQKEKFDTIIKELWTTRGKNARMFGDSECKGFIENVKKIRTTGHRMTPSDFYLLKRYTSWQSCETGHKS